MAVLVGGADMNGYAEFGPEPRGVLSTVGAGAGGNRAAAEPWSWKRVAHEGVARITPAAEADELAACWAVGAARPGQSR